MNIYVASSWRNLLQPGIVEALRLCGHEVYDFRNPPNKSGFAWEQVNPGWKRDAAGGHVEAEPYRAMLAHPIAEAGYAADIGALRDCDAVVYVLPCGRSASWEFGYAMGQGKRGYVVWFGPHEPELMFREATILRDMGELFAAFEIPRGLPSGTPEAEEQRRQADGAPVDDEPRLSVASAASESTGQRGETNP